MEVKREAITLGRLLKFGVGMAINQEITETENRNGNCSTGGKVLEH